MEDHGFSSFENGVLRRIFESKRGQGNRIMGKIT
jgi:hypothetical protein